MNAKPVFLRAVVCLVASTAAHAALASPTYSTSTLSGLTPSLFDSYTTTGNAGTVTASITNLYLAPAGVTAGSKYVYASPNDGAVNVNGINASTFLFLWGSPDPGNTVTYHTSIGDFVYTGSNLAADFGMSVNGNPAFSTVFVASLDNAATINSVTFTSKNIAFEVDGVHSVPEPGSVALVSLALGAVAWTGRRRAR